MERYTAGYSYTNFNFVIQNLKRKKDIKNKYYPFICILKNILQRGVPTIMSTYLTYKIGKINLDNKQIIGLIDYEVPNWINTIKGDNVNNYYPAKQFFYEIIPQYLKEYKFIQQLMLPEAEIKDIVGEENKEFINQKVDFYLEPCKLVIEIDGLQHESELQLQIDSQRDEYLSKFGVKTIRINTTQIKSKKHGFKKKINEIRGILEENENNLKLYNEYTPIDKYSLEEIKIIKACAVIRIQILILSLLERGIIKLDDDIWKINILQREGLDVIDIAIEDLFIWLKNICILDNIKINKPKIDILKNKNNKNLEYKDGYINIDFSLMKRYTDENKLNPNIIYVRTDYYNLRNNFKMSTADPICYKLDIESSECIKSLEFLLKNLFGYDEYRQGQLPIIINSLKGEDTVGILPTGTGKSLCYQMVGLLQPCINFVVCPIKSLMYDQVQNLKQIYMSNIETVTSDINADKKSEIIKYFSEEKYQFIFISPERFQSKSFRKSLEDLNINSTLGLAVIDEVHCLSEWGHDFRTSYLNLAKTIKKYAPSTRLLGLTATASNFVLNDIKREFEIESYNIKTTTSFNRKELTFKVIKCDEAKNNKQDILFSKLREMNDKQDIFKLNGKDTKSGIIFTPHVNGKKGCYQLSQAINLEFNIKSFYYGGKVPRYNKRNIMSEEKFNEYRNNVQKDFKLNKIPLLVATKAFGMGVDKPNIRYTIHYGMPMTLESLYQEAGRAGRDKKNADCYVLYEPEIIDKSLLNKFFSLNTPVEDLNEIQKGLNINQQKDILNNFFLWLSNNKGIDYEFKVINEIYSQYASPNRIKSIYCKKLGYCKADVEKAIYRLSVIGIIEDWTIEVWDSSNAVIEVTFEDYNIDSIVEKTEKYIRKYEKDFSFQNLRQESNTLKDSKTFLEMREVFENSSLDDIQKIIKALLIWVYDNIIYTRRQSIKTIADLCNNYKDSETFKSAIESYFKFDDDTYLLDDIAENPMQYEKWFEIFENEDGDIDKNKIQDIKGILGRFLESYRYNTGLNFISGIIRLLEDKYDDIDGEERLKNAFSKISSYDEIAKQEILDFSLKVGNQLNEKNKKNLSKILCENYQDLLSIHEALEDEYSLMLILEKETNKLKEINRRILCQMQEI